MVLVACIAAVTLWVGVLAHECALCASGEVGLGAGAGERCETRTEHVRNWMEVLAQSTGVSLSHLPTFCGQSPPPAPLTPLRASNRERQCNIIVRTIQKSSRLHKYQYTARLR